MWYVYWLSKLKQAIAEAEKLDMSRAKSYTLGAWIKLWYEVYAEPRLREKTKDYYLNYIDNHIVPELGNTPLEKLTTIQIQKFYNDLQKSGRIQRYAGAARHRRGEAVCIGGHDRPPLRLRQ